ncbi:MAG: hypothetical protein HQL30_08365 [Candidatus Omnitrophica bacterium]|nr:hypothetical protein [Candidatus Omnitrophota bacterium]
MERTSGFLRILITVSVIALGLVLYMKHTGEVAMLKKIISRLEADSRVAEVMVTESSYDKVSKKTTTTIKFLEYDVDGKPLEPRYFTFRGNVIQFQSLVIRFDDKYIRAGDKLKGKSVYLFRKVFMLDGKNTEEYDLAAVDEVPSGYRVPGMNDERFEKELWMSFWEYALDPSKANKVGVKNAQIEAPGTMFKKGIIYTLKIEHDGGLRIDSSLIPAILKGEKISGR